MSDEQRITPQQAILAVREAGLDPADLERQIQHRASGAEAVKDGDYIDRLERGLAELGERLERIQAGGVQPLTYEQQKELADRQLAERARDALNASITPWYEGGASDGDDDEK